MRYIFSKANRLFFFIPVSYKLSFLRRHLSQWLSRREKHPNILDRRRDYRNTPSSIDIPSKLVLRWKQRIWPELLENTDFDHHGLLVRVADCRIFLDLLQVPAKLHQGYSAWRDEAILWQSFIFIFILGRQSHLYVLCYISYCGCILVSLYAWYLDSNLGLLGACMCNIISSVWLHANK